MITGAQDIENPAGAEHPVCQDIGINEPDFPGDCITYKKSFAFLFGTPQPLDLAGLPVLAGVLADLVVLLGYRVVDPLFRSRRRHGVGFL